MKIAFAVPIILGGFIFIISSILPKETTKHKWRTYMYLCLMVAGVMAYFVITHPIYKLIGIVLGIIALLRVVIHIKNKPSRVRRLKNN